MKYDSKRGVFICPNCGEIDSVLEFDKVFLCYELIPVKGSSWEYKRLEDRDVTGDTIEYECPECGDVFYYIETDDSM